MATFVLIHGAWHGGWSFDLVRVHLERVGHLVITPDLPGMGGSDAELAAVSLGGWADFVADICSVQNEPVVLVGHSRGGIVISEVAERVPDHVSALVYVCAALIPTGYSRQSWREESPPNPAFAEIQLRHPSGNATLLDIEKAPALLAQQSPPELIAWAIQRLLSEPDRPRGETLHLTDNRFGSIPRHYIECLNDLAIPIAEQRRMQSAQPCANVITLVADHSPFLSAPQELADALLTILLHGQK